MQVTGVRNFFIFPASMKISDLARYGLMPRFLERVQAEQGETLLPLQARTVLEQGLFSGRSLWVSAPPSAGKTFLAELAFLKAIEERKKTIFAVPFNVLAAERVATFQKRYTDLGVRVLLSTRDHPQSDSLLAEGDFDLGIISFEKLNQLLVRKLDVLSTLGLLVIDEGQLLLDAERGKVLEKIFFKYLSYPSTPLPRLSSEQVGTSPKKPQLLVLSAGVANFSNFARWLGCSYVEDTHLKELVSQRYVFPAQPSTEFPSCELSAELLLDLVSSGAVFCADEILSGFPKKPKSVLPPEELSRMLNDLAAIGLLKAQEGKLFSTPLGKRAASSGLSVESFCLLYDFLNTAADLRTDGLFDLVYSLPELSLAIGRLAGWKGAFRRLNRTQKEADYTELEERAELSEGLIFPARTFFFLSLYEDWKSRLPLLEIELKYRASVEDLRFWADGTSWILATAGDLSGFLALPSGWVERLEHLSFEIRFALPAACRPLVLAFSEILFRDQFFKLLDSGCSTPEDVAALPAAGLQELFGAETGARTYEKARLWRGKSKQKLTFAKPPEAPISYSLYLDGDEEKNRFLAKVHGVDIFLPAKLFYYLFCLAKGQFTAPEGWVSVYAFEKGEGQGRFIFRLKKELKKALGRRFEIENNRRKMYRLPLAPEAIGFNFERLARFPDSRMARALAELRVKGE